MTATAAAHGSDALDRHALDAWGERFGASLVVPALVTLTGELGAGKTSIAQAICRGLGVTEPVTSPTFALVHQYRGTRAMVFHLDLYRIGLPHELVTIGWDEMLGANAVVLVEWPERAGATMSAPDHRLVLSHIESAPDLRRLVW